MPHEEMRRLIKRHIRGTEGSERIRILKESLDMLPGFYTGPYGELRKWVLEQIDAAKLRKESRHTDVLAVPRQGDAQVVLLGPPNAGKSSLLKALCARQVAVGDYPFTTLRPIAATALINDAYIQLVEIPGLIEGAHEGRGGGRKLLACARDADALIYVLPLDYGGLDGLLTVMAEAKDLDLETDPLVVCTKSDLPEAEDALAEAKRQFPDTKLLPVSVIDDDSLDVLRQAIWELTGLMRVYSRPSGRTGEDRPFIVPVGTTVGEMAVKIHHELAKRMVKAKVWGKSVRFDGQPAAKDHVLCDGDVIEIVD
jgi:ribosome-interacting GTPase 1